MSGGNMAHWIGQALVWLAIGAAAGWPVRKALRINDRRMR